MIWSIIYAIDFLLWIIIAGSVLYVCFFAVISIFNRVESGEWREESGERNTTFLVLYPAYHEDAVILHSVRQFLLSDYPKDKFRLAVISDHMESSTNDQLVALPITLLLPSFKNSSKAKALQYAIHSLDEEEAFDYVVILDADNVVRPDFLTKLEISCTHGYKVIQCHRCAKNSDNDIAVLDGVSEEINNTLFRRAHNTIGLSSALIGSGMCFDFKWFQKHVGLLNSAVEDRELETMLMKENIFIKFEDDIPVYDEKVSSSSNFQRQRLRWMTGQVQTLLLMMPYIPKAIISGNINYLDKTIQQALIPRALLIVFLALCCILSPLIAFFSPLSTLLAYLFVLKWWGLFVLLSISLLIALPPQLRRIAILKKITALPQLAWNMLANLFKINHRNKDFIHTTHNK